MCAAVLADDYDMAIAEKAWESGYQLGYKRGQESVASDPQVGIPPELLEDVIRLCHPDRHPEERFFKANAVTAQLNRLRDALREALAA